MPAHVCDRVQPRFTIRLLDPLHLLARSRRWWGLLAATLMIARAIRLHRCRDDS
jgi:hypothetical protein